jgi:hypothetical protein
MTAQEAFWNWAVTATIVLAIVFAGIFALGYLSVSLWRNRRRK